MPTYIFRKNTVAAKVRIAGTPGKTKTFKTMAEAKLWAEKEELEARMQIELQKELNVPAPSLKTILQLYWANVGAKHKGHKKLFYQIKRLQGIGLASIGIDRITPKHIRDFRDMRLQECKGATVNRDLAIISASITYAISEHDYGISVNPVSSIRRPSSGKGRSRRLTGDQEIESILQISGSEMLRDFVELALETAMRRGEILSLSKASFNNRARVIHLADTKNGEARDVPLSKKAFDIIQRRCECLSHPNDKLFMITPDAVTRAFARACKRAEVEDLRLHDLRHEAASRLFEDKGLSMMEVASITGHQDLKMLKRYTHMNAVRLVDKLD